MRKLLIVLAALFALAGCASPGMSGMNNWDQGSFTGAGND